MKRQKPRRRLELDIRIGADNWLGVERELKELLTTLAERGSLDDGFSVSQKSRRDTQVEENPEMTGQRYQKELRAWLDENRPPANRRGCIGG